ncbi:MAG: mechanosensitive ion channel family protein [Bacillales bacterium]|jgi:small conductance mechanosensitive channel|nr:mechanosensitive ion channel family protein [Bacillales bacterium]
MIQREDFSNALSKSVGDKFTLENVISFTVELIVVLLLAFIINRIGKFFIRKFFNIKIKGGLQHERRDLTLQKLLENILSYFVGFITIITILNNFFDVKGILAGAGVVGIAVGFGAQSLVKDIITGFFIIFEEQFFVGDYVRINTFEGTVTQIGLRITKVRAFSGEIQIIPNGTIIEVTNFSAHNSVAVVDISVAYGENIEKVEAIINEYLTDLTERYEDVVKTPELLGVQTLGPTEVVLRIICETLPMRHLQMSRQLRKDIKILLDEHGIATPLSKMMLLSQPVGNTNV